MRCAVCGAPGARGAFGATFEDNFATWTNLCYVAAGLACTPALRTAEREAARARPRGAFLLLLMGAASWAWHAESNAAHSPPHVLDIVFGWLLVTHLAYRRLVVGVDALFVGLGLRNRRWLRKGAQTALYIGLAVAIIQIFTRYDAIYADQLSLYLAAGPVCAVTVAARMRLLLTQQKGVTRRRGVLIALGEAAVVLGTTLASVYSQTDLLGRKIDRSAARAAYDLYHGNWHFRWPAWP